MTCQGLIVLDSSDVLVDRVYTREDVGDFTRLQPVLTWSKPAVTPRQDSLLWYSMLQQGPGQSLPAS